MELRSSAGRLIIGEISAASVALPGRTIDGSDGGESLSDINEVVSHDEATSDTEIAEDEAALWPGSFSLVAGGRSSLGRLV